MRKCRGMTLVELVLASGIGLLFLVSLSDMNGLLLRLPERSIEKLISVRMSHNFLTATAKEKHNYAEFLLLAHWHKSFAKMDLQSELKTEKRGADLWRTIYLWRGDDLFYQAELLLPWSEEFSAVAE